MDLEIVAAVITFVLGLLVGYLGRDRWNKLLEYIHSGYTIAKKVSDVIEKLAGSVEGAASLVDKVEEALKDGKITESELLEILRTWNKLKDSFEELREAIEDLRNTYLVEGVKK